MVGERKTAERAIRFISFHFSYLSFPKARSSAAPAGLKEKGKKEGRKRNKGATIRCRSNEIKHDDNNGGIIPLPQEPLTAESFTLFFCFPFFFVYFSPSLGASIRKRKGKEKKVNEDSGETVMR